MIKFSLQCEKSHAFEAWFRSGADFDTQRKRKILTCPMCDSHKIEKALMAPNVGLKTNRKTVEPATAREHETAETPVESAPDQSVPNIPVPDLPVAGAATGLPQEVREHVLELAREIRDHVTRTADNVGTKFAEEARKIHYEEVEPRGIFGQATPEEAHELNEEGIDIHALPVLPEDRN